MVERLDVIVIGGGAVGLAIARAFASAKRDVVVIERNPQLASETSARNSEVIHAGLYYPPGSIKARTCLTGNRHLYRYCAERNIAVNRCGKMIVATSEDEVPRLHAIMASALEIGVGDLTYLTATEAQAREPDLACVAACLSPSTGVIDSHDYIAALEADLLDFGATIALRTSVEKVSLDRDVLTLTTRNNSGQVDQLSARTLINAAGLGASHISDTLFNGTMHNNKSYQAPKTYFGKGHYFDYTGASSFSHLVYPMPARHALGIHLTRGIDGSVKFGPDLSWVKTLNYAFEDQKGARRARFYAAIQRYWPNLELEKLQPGMTGIRPKIAGPGEASADFAIHDKNVHGVPGYIALYGIESPGLTASLSLADYVVTCAGTRV